MKLKVVCRKVYDYIRYDLKEIAFPSSLPDPPHIKKRRKLTWHERFLVLKEASRLYGASWVRDIGPELRPNDYKKKEATDDKPDGVERTIKEKEPSTLEDLEPIGSMLGSEALIHQKERQTSVGYVSDTDTPPIHSDIYQRWLPEGEWRH
ncbi:Embryo defective protein [Quillaja saponaria]|uniref:Embryo defective protein n=1 Tax=Quillaja saponaria TaxID=32244 RepID=A0AAD7Q7M5_QUISA|nr:Embryo defective protein [Quillaja saponaria]